MTAMVNSRVYWFMIAVLVVLILTTGVKTAIQAHQHHELYQQLVTIKAQMQTLKIEEQRLIIEQQTFSSTPNVAQRSVSELGMFFPTDDEKMTIVTQ